MSHPDDKLYRYAPIWSALVGTGLAVTKKLSTRYMVEREVRFEWRDLGLAALAAVGSYALFRLRRGNRTSSWYKR